MNADEKTKLRKHFRTLRSQINIESRTNYAKLAAQILTNQLCFHRSQHIACYMSVHAEMSVMPLMELIWQQHKKCYLPVISNQNELSFLKYDNGDALIQNRYGIHEPKSNSEIELEHLDLIIIPLIAFDSFGHRLGAGGGYYDKTFANIARLQHPMRIGWAFSIQEAEKVPYDPWDVSLHAVTTEKKFILFNQGGGVA